MAVNRYLNILSFTITPTNTASTAPIVLRGVTMMGVQQGSSTIKGAGDGDAGPSSIDIDFQEPVLAVKFEELDPVYLAPLEGLRGSVVAIVGASGQNGGTAGAMQYTLSSMLCITKSQTNSYRKFSDADVEFHGIFTNGVNPLTAVKLAAVAQAAPPIPGLAQAGPPSPADEVVGPEQTSPPMFNPTDHVGLAVPHQAAS